MKIQFNLPTWESIKTFVFRFLHTCDFGDTFLYSFYEFVVRTLECKCCIFYRGWAVGFLAGMIWATILFFLFSGA